MPLTYGTAYEALVDRLEIKKGEKSGILIMNGGGGVGSIASQIARSVLDLPQVVTTASRPETVEFSKKIGATHVVSHRKNTVEQIRQLDLPGDVPL
jgi:NADPH:quinone reductase-like Zn-dependent oxidoreductase